MALPALRRLVAAVPWVSQPPSLLAGSVASANAREAATCEDALPGSNCDDEVRWARGHGIYEHPEWYPGLTPHSSYAEFQRHMHESSRHCPMPCTIASTPAGTRAGDDEADLSGGLTLPCTPSKHYTDSQFREVQRLNCVKVRFAAVDFEQARRTSNISAAQDAVWQSRATSALEMCRNSTEALLAGHLKRAAILAVEAWGSKIMDGGECCILVHPPYCLQSSWSASLFSIHTPVGILFSLLFVLFFATVIFSCIERTREYLVHAKEVTAPPAAAADAASVPLPTGTVGRPARGHLERLLLTEWLENSCLRHLPDAKPFAQATASLFAELQEMYDFQVDNCRNQYEHLLSLWRSHCAIVADRFIGREAEVDEGVLLAEGLRDLHTDLLDGFLSWRQKFCELTDFPEAAVGEPPPLGGARWTVVQEGSLSQSDAGELSRQLAEVTTYLLVWGEAGNLRFMPEVIYFITELALTAQAGSSSGGSLLGRPQVLGRSGLFLSRVVRPLYRVVFDEWYKYVKVESSYLVDNSLLQSRSTGLRYHFSKNADDEDPNREPAKWGSVVKGLDKGDGWVKVAGRFLPIKVNDIQVLAPKTDGREKAKDIKKLKKSFDLYLPADVANYDDWDEFFCDPVRLSDGLVLKGEGEKLFDLPCGKRFAALPQVDWAQSLRASVTKTHREVHSLWGVYATTHRIWLLHAVLFLVGVCAVTGDPPDELEGHILVGGRSAPVRFAAIGLIVPVHSILWSYARWETQSHAASVRCTLWRCGLFCCPVTILMGCFWLVLWFGPVLSYAAIRYLEAVPDGTVPFGLDMETCLMIHYSVSLVGLLLHLLLPGRRVDRIWRLAPVPQHLRLARYTFWLVVLGLKWLLGLVVFQAVYLATQNLNFVSPGHESLTEIANAYRGTNWSASVLQWLVIWGTTFFLFITDTQLWFILGCTFLGVVTTLMQRKCRVVSFAFEHAIAKIPELFSEKVLPYTHIDSRGMSTKFPEIWNEVVEKLYVEDKCKNTLEKGDLSYGAVQRKLFLATSAVERCARHYCGAGDETWPYNKDLQWRVVALSRGLGLPMPRPFRAPYIPGITVLIPHYGETILMRKGDLYNNGLEETVPLINWLVTRYKSEFEAFTNRMGKSQAAFGSRPPVATAVLTEWPEVGSNWSEYQDHHWDKICKWASLRMQTLYRTVAGMTLYDRALQCHFDAQGLHDCSLARSWSPSNCFNCLVSMQMYKTFDKTQLEHTNQMFAKFPPSLKVAFIDWEDKDESAEADGVHPRQERRYFSCLIDQSCATASDGRRNPRLRVELPGYAILGDGKGDNQNHAIPFMRGTFCQCIDANQGAYFEQMLLLPCVLGEFRTHRRGDGGSKRIIGLPEHITSDFGSIGDFAAGSEVAFGTILQRSYAVLGGRMHYGHPDIMNKEFMMQQGGVSKATKTLNLSEDIFAGMDFTLRGGDRAIKHCEYFHLAKGRDLGFNTVLGFFSKLSSGAGEQILTRQMFRLGQLMHLPECLTFYYAHVGYYISQALISWSLPIVVFAWLLILMADCEDNFRSFLDCPEESASLAMARMLSIIYSWLLFAFLFATSLPLFVENWMERGLKTATARIVTQYVTLSPLLFIFQAKIIGYYVLNELRYGGATYVSTGRGLPTERRPFIGIPDGDVGFRIKDKDVGGLYLDYTLHTYYHGMALMAGVILVGCLGGGSDAGVYRSGLFFTWLAITLTLISWLHAPFIFNPYQFSKHLFRKDLRAWAAFFFQENGRKWVSWYETNFLKRGGGWEKSVVDVSFFLGILGLTAVFSNMYRKLKLLTSIYSTFPLIDTLQVLTLIPPIISSTMLTFVLAVFEGLYTSCQPAPKKIGKRFVSRHRVDEEVGDGSSDSEESSGSESGEVSVSGNIKKQPYRVPLAAWGLVVSFLEIVEAVAPLVVILQFGWRKAFVAGLVLKFMLFQVVLNLAETLLRYRCFVKSAPHRERCSSRPMELWVHSNRIVRDLITSAFILCTLVPGVLANSLNEYLAPGLNIHQLLIYRAAHLSPQHFDSRYEDSDGSLSSGEDPTSEARLLRDRARHS